MLIYIGDSAKRSEWEFYINKGIIRAKENFEVIGSLGIANKLGEQIDASNLASVVVCNNGTAYAVPEGAVVDEWVIAEEQLMNTENYFILYDLDLSQRTNLPTPLGTTIAFLKHRNINLLRNVKRDDGEQPRFIPVISMNCLRANGATVSKAISWERTAIDFLRDLSYGVSKELLGHFPMFIIILETEGMIVLQKEQLILYFTPSQVEGDTGELDNETQRNTICAEIVKQIVSGKNDFSKVIKSTTGMQFLPKYNDQEDLESWSILNEVCGRDRLEVIETAKKIVIRGEKEILEAVPSCQYGDLQTVDRMEIENYHAIINLITNYAKGKETRPLSISVFGFPGSGKSFGIKQIAKFLGGFEIFTFNLSQFTKHNELEVAFQEIRDASIKGIKLPLVFFDEFDSVFNGEKFGWLKIFLAPMQDGIFMEEGHERRIGRAIFVFAGGTSTSFAKFSGQVQDTFRDAKGPDFISRLKGYLNIQGPNPVSEEDHAYIIRRAMLLRSMITRDAKQLLDDQQRVNIDENILYALLSTETYRHGARSLEFFISMSPLFGEKMWCSSLLPPRSQMDIHVDAEEFMCKVSVLSMCKELARISHEMYVNAELTRNPEKGSPAVSPWDSLEETYRQSNISQIQFHVERFKDSNIAIRQKKKPYKDFVFKDDDLLALSKSEHERWSIERIKNGWVYGVKRDDVKKLHNDLIPWEQLSEENKLKISDVIKSIPTLFNRIGLEFYYKNLSEEKDHNNNS